MNSALKWMPLMAALALAGCARDGYYDDRSVDYAEADKSAPLVLPGTRDTRRYRDAMPVPEAPGAFASQGDDFRAPPPRALGASHVAANGDVSWRQAGDQRWLVVGRDPGIVWSELNDFVAARGLNLVSRDDSRGVLETDQGRLSVRPGIRTGESEVHCTLGGAPVAACLNALQSRFESLDGLASASASSLAAQGQNGRRWASQPPRLEQRDGEWQLLLPYDIGRAWAELDFQLEADFTLEDRRKLVQQDFASRTFEVSYLPLSERSRNPFQSLATFNFSRDPRLLNLTLESLGANQTRVVASSADGEPLEAGDSRELLERLGGLLR